MNATVERTALFLVELRGLSVVTALGPEAEGLVWREVTKRVETLLGADRTLERTGSEELAVLLTGLSAEEVRRTAARLREALYEEISIPAGGVRCPVAVGVVVSGSSPERTLADDAVVARARRALRDARASTDGVFVLDRAD